MFCVWLDDLEIRHKGAIIAQETHYDPWGLELVGIGRQGLNRFTFNGQSEKQANLADGKGYFYETDFRSYDATLGRFHAYDLMASGYSGITPYHFALNNPISANDPTGLEADSEEIKKKSANNSEGPGPKPVPQPIVPKPFLPVDPVVIKPVDIKPLVATPANTDNVPSVNSGSSSENYELLQSLPAKRSDKDNSSNNDSDRTRRNIATNALTQVGSEKWRKDVKKDNFKKEKNKCNKFVYDILTDEGASPNTPNGWLGGSPPTAEQWADPDFRIDGWKVVQNSEPKPGDVVAQKIKYSDATGHVAIVTTVVPTKNGGYTGFSVGTSSHLGGNIAHTNWGFRAAQEGKVVFRRFVGKPLLFFGH